MYVSLFKLSSNHLYLIFLRLLLSSSTGHSGQHGHEFLEFEYSRGRLRYANNSNYRNDSLIRKESQYSTSQASTGFNKASDVIYCHQMLTLKSMLLSPVSSVWVSQLLISELRRLVEESEIIKLVLGNLAHLYFLLNQRQSRDLVYHERYWTGPFI